MAIPIPNCPKCNQPMRGLFSGPHIGFYHPPGTPMPKQVDWEVFHCPGCKAYLAVDKAGKVEDITPKKKK